MSNALLKKETWFEAEHEALIKIFKETPVLSREEEKALFRALRKNPDNKDLRQEIILANLKLVASWVNKIIKKRRSTAASTLDFWDLFQAGTLGLMTAVEKFDPELGNKFSTYGSFWIQQAILRYLIETGRLIRIPVYLNDRLGAFFKVRDRINQEMGEEPSPEKIALEMNIPLEKVLELQSIIDGGKVESLYIEDDDEHSLIDMLPSRGNDLEATVERVLLKEAVQRMLEDSLGTREREILKLRFGLEDGKFRTLEAVGKKFCLTRERVRQIEAAALRKLRGQPKYREFFRDFIQ